MKIGLGKPLCHLLGHWLRVREVYLDEHFLELFAHWICPICSKEGASKLSEVEATLDRQSWKLTFLVLIPLFIFGGSVIHDFAFTLIVGAVIGTYSSIFVASAFVVWWRERQKSL